MATSKIKNIKIMHEELKMTPFGKRLYSHDFNKSGTTPNDLRRLGHVFRDCGRIYWNGKKNEHMYTYLGRKWLITRMIEAVKDIISYN